MAITISKKKGSDKLFDIDCSRVFRDRSDTVIQSIVSAFSATPDVVGADAISFGTPSYSNKLVQVTMGGGGQAGVSEDITYEIVFSVKTQYDPEVEINVFLVVTEK